MMVDVSYVMNKAIFGTAAVGGYSAMAMSAMEAIDAGAAGDKAKLALYMITAGLSLVTGAIGTKMYFDDDIEEPIKPMSYGAVTMTLTEEKNEIREETEEERKVRLAEVDEMLENMTLEEKTSDPWFYW